MEDWMERLVNALHDAVATARARTDGAPAAYIPELALADPELTSAAVETVAGARCAAGDADRHRFTLQSSAKLVLLAGLLEERGDAVFDVVGTEPTGGGFSSVAWLEQHGPRPANPLVNAGAIALAGLLEGNLEDRLAWLDGWIERLCGRRLAVNQRVLASERRTGHRNRAFAHELLGQRVIRERPDEVLESYFALCSYEATVHDAAALAAVFARGGRDHGGAQAVSTKTARAVVALMATCGMYDESGAHLVATGLPAKSGVSGVIVAVAPGRAGIAVASPRVNTKGGSVRGHVMLQHLSRALDWHFATPVDP